MKHAFNSMVLPVATLPERSVIKRIDAVLAKHARAHEIVIVAPYGESLEAHLVPATRGALSIVTTHIRSTPDGAVVAGLARAVGDFVIEWRGPLGAVEGQLIDDLLKPSETGVELVEAIGIETSRASRLFSTAVNSLRSRQAPLRKAIGRTYSRGAVQMVLANTAFEKNLNVLVADRPVHRASYLVPYPNPHSASIAQRLVAGFALLFGGTRFGSTVPLTLAALSALFAITATINALGIWLLRGQTPEGWTTLMVIMGLGQAAILTMLGLTWNRMNFLIRGMSRSSDATAGVVVMGPATPIRAPDGDGLGRSEWGSSR